MKDERDWEGENFEHLLEWLDPDRERAGARYEEIRRALIKIFAGRGCAEPEDLADETLRRVCRKVRTLAPTYVGDPACYFYGVAQNVHLESLRGRGGGPSGSAGREALSRAGVRGLRARVRVSVRVWRKLPEWRCLGSLLHDSARPDRAAQRLASVEGSGRARCACALPPPAAPTLRPRPLAKPPARTNRARAPAYRSETKPLRKGRPLPRQTAPARLDPPVLTRTSAPAEGTNRTRLLTERSSTTRSRRPASRTPRISRGPARAPRARKFASVFLAAPERQQKLG